MKLSQLSTLSLGLLLITAVAKAQHLVITDKLTGLSYTLPADWPEEQIGELTAFHSPDRNVVIAVLDFRGKALSKVVEDAEYSFAPVISGAKLTSQEKFSQDEALGRSLSGSATQKGQAISFRGVLVGHVRPDVNSPLHLLTQERDEIERCIKEQDAVIAQALTSAGNHPAEAFESLLVAHLNTEQKLREAEAEYLVMKLEIEEDRLHPPTSQDLVRADPAMAARYAQMNLVEDTVRNFEQRLGSKSPMTLAARSRLMVLQSKVADYAEILHQRYLMVYEPRPHLIRRDTPIANWIDPDRDPGPKRSTAQAETKPAPQLQSVDELRNQFKKEQAELGDMASGSHTIITARADLEALHLRLNAVHRAMDNITAERITGDTLDDSIVILAIGTPDALKAHATEIDSVIHSISCH